MVKIPEALARRDYIKTACGEIDLFGGHRIIIYLHPGFIRQALCLLYLLRRDIRTCPVCTVPVHIPGQHACARPQIKHLLPVYAETSVHYFPVEFIRIYIPVFCIFFRGSPPVECLAVIYTAVCYHHICQPSHILHQFLTHCHFANSTASCQFRSCT